MVELVLVLVNCGNLDIAIVQPLQPGV